MRDRDTTPKGENMLKIQIILGSTRPGRAGEAVAKWAQEIARQRKDAEFELVDIADYNLPLMDEPVPPLIATQYTKAHTRKWSEKIVQADGYIFVTAEYNRSIPGALKNAIDYLNKEWKDKAVGFVGYGTVGGARAIEHLRGVAGELHMADVREALTLLLPHDFENYAVFKPTQLHEQQLGKVFDGVIQWATVLKTLRA
jgi:NAD(P)H-dependent FMN reductase